MFFGILKKKVTIFCGKITIHTHFCRANHNDLFSQKVQCLLSSFCTLCIYWHFFHSPDTATYLEREAVAIVDCF